ncbi:MAG: hypothetical protein LBS68_00230 [Puniceicoccales bacterium]|nr:hypothetical protein [Puniceicoccales bacterium]
MDSPQESPRTPGVRSRIFWLVFVFVVAAAIIGFAVLRRSIRRAQDARFLREIMLVQEALAQFAEASSDEVAPRTKLAGDAAGSAMETAIGGRWRLRHSEGDSQESSTELLIENPNRPISEMEALDAAIDDGDLSTGAFVLRGPDSYSIKLLGKEKTGEAAKKQVDLLKEAAPSAR